MCDVNISHIDSCSLNKTGRPLTPDCHPIHLKYVTLIPPLNLLQILDVYTLDVCHKHKGNNGSVL